MDRKRLLRNPLLWILAVVLLYLAFSTIFDDNRGYAQVSTTQAVTQVTTGNVEKATLEDKEQQLKLTLKDAARANNQKQIFTSFPAQAGDDIFNLLRQNNVEFETKVTQDSFLSQILLFAIP